MEEYIATKGTFVVNNPYSIEAARILYKFDKKRIEWLAIRCLDGSTYWISGKSIAKLDTLGSAHNVQKELIIVANHHLLK